MANAELYPYWCRHRIPHHQGSHITWCHAAYVAVRRKSKHHLPVPLTHLPPLPLDLSNFVQPVVTATPNSDGDTYHVVLYGQSLFAIATWYGVTVDKIKELNSLTSDAIYEGQKLLISIKPTPTITPTRTATVPQPTRTPTSTKAPPTPAPTITITPTPDTESLAVRSRKLTGSTWDLAFLLISAIGFLIVLLKSFLKPIPKK